MMDEGKKFPYVSFLHINCLIFSKSHCISFNENSHYCDCLSNTRYLKKKPQFSQPFFTGEVLQLSEHFQGLWTSPKALHLSYAGCPKPGHSIPAGGTQGQSRVFLLAPFLVMQPRILLTFQAARAHCWLMFGFLSTRTESFSAGLLCEFFSLSVLLPGALLRNTKLFLKVAESKSPWLMALSWLETFARSHTWCCNTLALWYDQIVAAACCGPTTAHLFSVTAFPCR